MTRILVAEDSPTQSVQIRALLEASNFEVDVVANGKEAVQRLENQQRYDLILTDMMMPEMDGLQLVRAVRVHYPGTPVILMTGQGTDALAIEALEDGAAGYVPKSQVQDKLVDEVAQVLHATEIDRSYEVLLSCLTRNEFSFELRNEIALIDPLINLLMQMMAGIGLGDSTSRVRVGLALEHALLNALIRGNLEIAPTQMPSTRDLLLSGQVADWVQQRMAQSPYGDRKIFFDVQMTLQAARFVIRDEGPGFDTSRVPRPGDPDVLEREGGHGLLLMQTFMDEVTFNASGNQVTMIKRRES
jgi:CheY-like chemotaxis protein